MGKVSEPKFTPGPWHIGYGKTVETFGSGDFFAIGLKTEPDWKAICLLSPADSVNDTDKANAHLIAAAPELYRALEECADDLTAWISDRYPESDLRFPSIQKDFELDMSVVDKARNALAKARGER